MGTVRIGTSGWVYEHWRHVFYPQDVPQTAWLEFYTRHFDTVEINNSFYRLPKPETFESWRQRSPEGFMFAVKGSRFITHLKRLKEPEEALKRFFASTERLGPRCGPILWQLPPGFQRDDGRLEHFLSALPQAFRHAFEFRHESWFTAEVYELLAKHRAALCIPDRPDLPKDLRSVTDWSYIRLHSSDHAAGSYSRAELSCWAERIRSFAAEGADVWVYFNNDQYGFAVDNARCLRELLGSQLAATRAGLASPASILVKAAKNPRFE